MVDVMSLRRFLGLGHGAPARSADGDTATVRRVVAALERMEPEAARHVARFAYVLGRVAGADRGVSPEKTRAMERTRSRLFGSTENYLVTREFASTAKRAQKLALLDCCMAVAAVDQDVSGPEDDVVREIARELGLTHADFIAARSAYRDALAVLKPPRTP